MTDLAPLIMIPPEVEAIARDELGAFFEPISAVDRRALASDFLDIRKAWRRAEILERYTQLPSKKVLEVGSGFGTNLAEWIKRYRIDGYGVEPGAQGFDAGVRASRLLFEANGLDATRITNAHAESLPFPDASFDIVYSSNVLEHTRDPHRVVGESLRVLRAGGLFHMEMPNFLSYFEGHYMTVQPPIVWKWMLPAWLRLRGRNPAFARTLNTEINPGWCRGIARDMRQTYELDVLSLGEDVFLERLARPFTFETAVVSGKLGGAVSLLRRVNAGNWIGRTVVGLQGHYPIYFTMRKHGLARTRS